MKDLQKLATQVFVIASVLFGLTGIIIMLSAREEDDPALWLMKILGVLGFVVLSSFGVSVGLKYLTSNK